MEMNGIVLSPDPRLRQECAAIEEITPEIEQIVERMKVDMFENGGCGLAAPQIGELIQLAIVDTEYSCADDYDPFVLINPVIVEQSDTLAPFDEGCLSIPGINCKIMRPDHVVVEAYNLEGDLMRYGPRTTCSASASSTRSTISMARRCSSACFPAIA